MRWRGVRGPRVASGERPSWRRSERARIGWTMTAAAAIVLAAMRATAVRAGTPPAPPEEHAVQAPAGSGTRGSSVAEWIDRTDDAHRSARKPSAAEDCAVFYYPPHHSLVLFGGKGDDNKNVNELWE